MSTKDVLVVIGAGGMGEAIARRQGAGMNVVVSDFDEQLVEDRVDALGADGFEVHGVVVDVSQADSVSALADTARGLGTVAQVAHTAGLSPVQAPVDAILRVDLLGVAIVLDVFEEVVSAGSTGVVIASMAGHMGSPLSPAEELALANTSVAELLALPCLSAEHIDNPGTAYTVAKRANQVRVQSASVLWGARGARVNSISPGIISTRMGQEELATANGDIMRMMIGLSGTGRIGTSTDIAEAAAFLLGRGSSFVTGTDLLVDGGVVGAVRTNAGFAAAMG
jgi:meso-butanediol dehydrogenase/(S,S)-butanediol dehydrogenase/diacetyl reductase